MDTQLTSEQPESTDPPVRFEVGHYYSPMYDARTLLAEPTRSRIWPAQPHDQPGIDWNPSGQRRFLVDIVEHLARDVAFEATDDVALGHSLRGATGDVGLGALITGEAHHHDAPECVVGDAIATAVEAMSIGLSGRSGHR